MTLANAHALFCGLKAEPSYLANLTISDKERSALLDARNLVRQTLRMATKALVQRDDVWRDAMARINFRDHTALTIKFMTQGSFAYGTLNAPAQVPKQEIDLDDGMYVPVQFLANGEPALTAKGLFKFVDEVLDELCRSQGWALDDSKDNCARVKLWPGAHIDLPIYSIPQDRFEALVEKAERSFAACESMAMDSATPQFKLPSDKIMLARRDGTWIQSDPKLMHDWVDERAERYGPVYRRLCRFFKGWRDYIWEKPLLSSICLMAAVDTGLNSLPALPSESRDDQLIMEIAKQLPEILRGRVGNPVIRDLCLNEWSDDDRRRIIDEAEKLRDEMVAALTRTGDADRVVTALQKRFGTRIPYRPDAVKMASQIAAIQSATPVKNPAPRVYSSTSG